MLAILMGLALVGSPASARTVDVQAVTAPPMGWASWNSFAAQINYDVIRAQTDAIVSSGMKDAGYQYVNIDEGWWQGTRDSAGNITVDTREWPGGMAAIADYIHSKGLKAGIYTDAGRDGCGYYYPTGRPAAPGSGSEGHYDQDFLQFSKWGFDFVKVDWCCGGADGCG
ncbi:glycoside hydrolase family 27 protein [Kibdelosporangium lantanae]|uniref:Alpha-galactosidase n=1 Tax=Kibdelosporangium lantanae TaxID=1497396 RepID=A0ABW3MG11_9PSEU